MKKDTPVRDFIYKTLTPSVPPMAYILMGISVFIGFCFATDSLLAGSESVLYDTGVLVHKRVWGAALFFTASCAELGFIFKKRVLILLGGMTGFMAWTFASIALFLDRHWYILVSVALLHLLFHGYVYLATALSVLDRPLKTS